MADIEETKAEIRFALSQLSAHNRHHEFEHLARWLARMTVTANILPATGPVAAGGDQGRDFETYRTELPGQVQALGREIGVKEGEDVGFCCTLQQEDVTTKFSEDVKNIVSQGTGVSYVVAYCEVNVPTAARHRVQERMTEAHAIHVEIFDGTAISELLAQRHTFWIAEQFLHLSARALPPESDRPHWYEEDLGRWREDDTALFSVGHLVDLTGCLRYATFHEDATEDLPFWLAKMELLLGDGIPSLVRHKAQYEIVVASLRGLGDMRPVDDLATAFIEHASQTSEPSVLYDAAVLLLYCLGALARGLTNHSDLLLMRWNAQLTATAEGLLEEAMTPGRRCSLLEVVAMLKLHPDLVAMSEQGLDYELDPYLPRLTFDEWNDRIRQGVVQALTLILIDREGALTALTRLVDTLKDAPLFPVDAIAYTLLLHARHLVDDPRYDTVVLAIDERIADVEGRAAAAERARDRGMSLLEGGRLLEALRELHRARSGWFSGEASRGLVLATLMTAEIYNHLSLYAAAKYYALVAAALVQRDDLDLYPRSLFKASVADYHQGAWFSAMQIAEKAVRAHNLLAEDPFDLAKHEDLAACLFEVRVIQATANKAGSPYSEFASAILDRVGLAGILDELFADVTESPWWEPLTSAELYERIVEQLGRPAFSDAGTRRSIKWSALGVSWSVEFDNTYPDTLVGERIAAAAQVVLADIALRDPALLPTEVVIEAKVAPPDSQIEVFVNATGPGTRWRVALRPIDAPDPGTYNRVAAELIGVMRAVVGDISVLREEQLENLFHDALEGDLMSHVMFGIPFDIAYSSLNDGHGFSNANRNDVDPLGIDTTWPANGPGLEFPDQLGPGYTHEAAEEQVAGRYEQLPPLLLSTLPALRVDPGFQDTVRELRAERWPDWQILLAVFNVAKNVRMQPIAAPQSEEEARQLRQRFLEPEPPEDPIDPDVFTTDRLREAITLTLGSTLLNQWKLELRQNPPDFDALRELLVRRYRYGLDDVEHEDPFVV